MFESSSNSYAEIKTSKMTVLGGEAFGEVIRLSWIRLVPYKKYTFYHVKI
jgi:hypothetical protein